jgi:hypothetical protein
MKIDPTHALPLHRQHHTASAAPPKVRVSRGVQRKHGSLDLGQLSRVISATVHVTHHVLTSFVIGAGKKMDFSQR